MKGIIKKLPNRLQEGWRDSADDIINVEAREVTIDDILALWIIRCES